MIVDDREIISFIEDALEQNFELLKLESGHSVAQDIMDTAREQVRLYWRKLNEIATRVTETEVRLNLPDQRSPAGRKFGIEGVVDIVQEEDKTIMYDIKTHEADQVRDNIGAYERQLNIYAHIWKNLRGQRLDKTAIIATAYPEAVKEALSRQDEGQLAWALEHWEPVVEIDFNPAHLEEILVDFGHVVDCIEDYKFQPAPVEKLRTRYGDERSLFATRVCRNCDARFSCSSYRTYALGARGAAELDFRQYIDDFGTDLEQQDWLSSNLEFALTIDELE